MDNDPIHRKITEILNDALKHIGSKKRRAEVIAELETHVFESFENNLKLGHSADEAIAIAMKNLGPLHSLSEEFKQVYPPLYRRTEFWLISIFVSILMLSSGMLIELYHALHLRVEARDQIIEKKIDRWVQDQAPLGRLMKEFPGPKNGSDAGKDLNFRITWREGSKLPSSQTQVTLISISPMVSDRLRQAKGDWLNLVNEPKLFSEVSTEWMQKLATYEYWEIFLNSPVESKLNESPVSSLGIPLPDYGVLISEAKIRLLQGMVSKNPLQALQEVRHLARLLFTNEVLVAPMAAWKILGTEKIAYDWLVAHHRIQAQDWHALSDSEIEKSKLAIYASMDIFNVLKMNAYWEKVLAEKPIGLCAGLTEGIDRGGFVKALILKRWPLEQDFSDTLNHVNEILASPKHGCRLTLARAQWLHYWPQLTSESFWLGDESPPLYVKLLVFVSDYPYLRRLSANVLNAFAVTTTSYRKDSSSER